MRYSLLYFWCFFFVGTGCTADSRRIIVRFHCWSRLGMNIGSGNSFSGGLLPGLNLTLFSLNSGHGVEYLAPMFTWKSWLCTI